MGPDVSLVVLTTGNRPDELSAAIASAVGQDGVCWAELVVVNNGAELPVEVAGADVVDLPANVGVPAGRNVGAEATTGSLIVFLDDDATLEPGALACVVEAFDAEAELGAVALRIVDEFGGTSRRHVPRVASRGVAVAGEVTHFLGGASVIRREAFEAAGGYWGELWYGHEELELSWRLLDRGWRIRYLPDARVVHPRTEISRHADGWHLTGRNRVMVARRDLPLPLMLIHTVAWLVAGALRSPDGPSRRAYVSGWYRGWRVPVPRDPIGWRTVVRLSRLGRPPVL